MNLSLLNIEIQEFINNHLNSDITTLLLKGIPFNTIYAKEIIEQIEAKKRCETKLPKWFHGKNIYYPNKLHIEQTSSEITANHKSELINGDTIIDLTGGFGVDCYYFSNVFKNVEYCEINESLSKLVNHNYKQLGIQNIKTHTIDGIVYLEKTNHFFDWIYIDPSRRHDSKGKVFFLNDCLPNVPKYLDLLFKHSKNILIKTSPLLDISVGVNELKYVKTIRVVAVNNEVKELLWILEAGFNNDVLIETVNLKKDQTDSFNFSYLTEKTTHSKYSKPLTYLYEPNSAILKSGGFHSVSKKLNVYKLHLHAHLYTSNELIDFPGRIFKIENVIPFNKKELKKAAITKANITTRNFPESVEELRKKLNIRDGGSLYLFFTTDFYNNKIVIFCCKIA